MLLHELNAVLCELILSASLESLDLDALSSLLTESDEPELPKCIVRPF